MNLVGFGEEGGKKVGNDEPRGPAAKSWVGRVGLGHVRLLCMHACMHAWHAIHGMHGMPCMLGPQDDLFTSVGVQLGP